MRPGFFHPRHRVDFGTDQRAMAATEFALILPFMVALLLGGIEVSDAVSLGRKVTLTAHTVTDLVTQNTCLSTSEMSTIIGATSAIVAPYSSANLSMTVTEISTDANSKATVTWTTSSTLAVGTVVTLPTALQQPNATYIWGLATYSYKPTLGYKLTGTINITDQMYLSPRLSTTISYPGSC
jgi:Flp pilus assembly protein TadG